ncbi:BMP family lipoprotein [Ornithinibacillus californiensis]|uniref:BMP family lipoprotein n=1 Tax=Ornithinibacillus californiensis TaxID=161536 RepID=UPI00064DDA38|nr:BMP family ABC transporter substrate-binding protein [Ornithinibacillus californiensis]
MKKLSFLLVLILGLGLLLAACGGGDDNENESGNENNGDDATNEETADFKVGMVTDIGGVDDKSFNQSAWEGLTAFGEQNNLSEGEGFHYLQSNAREDYIPNLNRMVRDGFNLIYGIGFELKEDLTTVAGQNSDVHFGIVDDVIDAPNVASITFKEHQGSFLVGVAAALKTKTNKLGFVGGVDSPLINKFEAGFIAGAKSVNPDIEVDVQYAESFADAAKGKLIAANMYDNGIDVIYHASGATGNGVFNQAKDIKQNDPEREIWVIGVDRDQHEEGQVGDQNVTLTSMIKRVDVAVQEVATMALNGEFPGGELLEFGIEEEGIAFATTNADAMTEEIVNTVNEWQDKILNGDVTVPSTHDELEEFEAGL